MKKTLVLIPMVLFLFFAFIFVSGLALGNLLHQVKADEILPYSLIGKNDTFSLTLKTDQSGLATAITYGYEYAD